MTKAEKIRALYAKDNKTTGEIAKIVGCGPEYVRVVARQRVDRGKSESDKRYILRRFGDWSAYWRYMNEGRDKEAVAAYRAKRWREDPEYRRRKYERTARWHARKRELRQRESAAHQSQQ